MKLENPLQKLPLFWRLTASLEAFTHIVPVPVAVYFTIITGAIQNSSEVILVLICASIGGLLMVVCGMLWRYYNLKLPRNLLSRLKNNQEVPISDFKAAKIRLLNHPRQESRIIALRWFVGAPLVHLMFGLIIGFRSQVLLSLPFLFLIVIPVSSVAYFFLSENIIRQILGRQAMMKVRLSPDQVPYLGYFRRILMAIASLCIMLVTLFGYLLYAVSSGQVIGQPVMHISIIIGLFVLPLIVTSYAVARAVKNGLNETNTVLDQLGLGNLKVNSAIASADEFGLQSHNLSRVIVNLRNMYKQITDANENLENKVQVRTEKLNSTLEEVKKLKDGQDGDYLLTSLLFKPFALDKMEQAGIRLESYIRQKKVFSFRKWEHVEIGGDMCLADVIQLKGQDYLFFCNADAMGKSLQGATGILIFGAIIKSLLDRTGSLEYEQALTPERWIKQAFEEAHHLFVAFDGSMLISCVFGLIETGSGMTYFINAEHPFPVLSRNGKAGFLAPESMTRKLGTPDINEEVAVQTLRLQNNDVLWLGSDGKDDLELFNSKEISKREINYDETMFLRMLDVSDNKMQKLLSNLEEQGDFMDDLSLMRISYESREKKSPTGSSNELVKKLEPLFKNRNFSSMQEIYSQYQDDEKINIVPVINRWMAIAYYFRKNYAKSAAFAENYILHNPSHDSMIYLAARSRFNTQNFEQAKELLDRLMIRNPGHLAYTLLQARVMHEAGDTNQAIKLLKKYPDTKSVQKLLQLIER